MNRLLNENKTLKDCLICSSSSEEGIHLLDLFICSNCEGELVDVDVGDPQYSMYVRKLRRVRDSLNVNKTGEVPK
ncbi:sigma factor G inhibitor Gin [Salipaludibacillus sp. HK11]|uniref:sigma factor G inhibitor Gin n=1 Tax=Salipaludibacillus sp. HK11 TaxID=3394320 RepID=UPI0039FC672D